MLPIPLFIMSLYSSLVLLPLVAFLAVRSADSQHTGTDSTHPQPTSLDQSASEIQSYYFAPPADGHHEDIQKGQEILLVSSDSVASNSSNSTEIEDDDHSRINKELAEDEERVLAGGEIKVRKKRFFCKSCFPTQSYGYGGGGGCCGACGQCGGGSFIKPIKMKLKLKLRPMMSYGGYGGGGGCCGSPCGVCGRK